MKDIISESIEKMSDKVLANYIIENYPNEEIDKIFELFSVSCENLCQPEYRKLDELIEKATLVKKIKASNIEKIIILLRSFNNTVHKTDDLVEAVKNYINEHLFEDFSHKDIATATHFSLYYMLHCFKKATGLTILEYKNNMRLSEAKKQLIETNKAAKDIAAECGFPSYNYFTKSFKTETKVTPTKYRKIMLAQEYKNDALFKLADDKDIIFFNMLPHIKLMENVDIETLTEPDPTIEHYKISLPDETYGFLHEPAVIVHKKTIFAAWYNCGKTELKGQTPIRFSKSTDDGKTWTEPKTVAEDPSGKILYCPPVFGIDDGKLYMFLNQMIKADYMHSLDLYIYNEHTEEFDFLWSRPIPFKLNTNVYRLPNGKLILPGRMGELDEFPITPAVLISDSGKIDAEWRMVKVSEDGYLCDGSKQIYPETSLIINGDKLYMLSRNDTRKIPLLYISEDFGETWSEPYSHNIPIPSTKAYSGTLSDGRNYIIGNLYLGRKRLAMFLSEPDTMKFVKGLVINNEFNEKLGFGEQWHYPSAYENNGKLYIIQTVTVDVQKNSRGAVLSVVDLNKI